MGLLKSFLAQRSTPLLGIDISPAAIRVIEIARLSDGWRVEHYAEHELSRAVMREGSIAQVDQITQDKGIRIILLQHFTVVSQVTIPVTIHLTNSTICEF
jgi:Tfp pilus assembly PilM family ATPase